MTEKEVYNYIGKHYHIEKDENGNRNPNNYHFTAGCYVNNKWLSLSAVCDIVIQMLEENGLLN